MIAHADGNHRRHDERGSKRFLLMSCLCRGSLSRLSKFGSLPRVPPQKCRSERPLAERRKMGTDVDRLLDTTLGPAH